MPDPASLYVCKPSRDRPDRRARRTARTSSCSCRSRPTPSIGRGGDDGGGSEAVERTADAAIDQVAAWAGIPDLRDRIVVRRTVGPEDFARRLQRVARRRARASSTRCGRARSSGPANASRKVDGLLYAGASTIPGVGLPMCLISAELVLKRLTRRPDVQPAGAADGGDRDEPAALVLRRHAGLLPGRHAPARPRLPAPGAAPAPTAAADHRSRPGRRSWSGTSTPPAPGTGASTRAQTLPWRVGGVPLEEVAFFVVIPLVVVLTFEAVKVARGGTRPPAATGVP